MNDPIKLFASNEIAYLKQEDRYWIFFDWNEYSLVENLKFIGLVWGRALSETRGEFS